MADEEVLGKVAIEMDLKDSKFKSQLSGTKQAIKNTMSEMRSNMAVMNAAGSKYDALAAKQRGLNRVLEAQTNHMKALQKQYQGSITKSGEWTRATARYAQQYNDARGKVAALNQQLIQNAKAMAIARTETTGFTGKLNSMGKAASSAGEKLTSFGKGATAKITAPLAAGFAYATKSAVDFNSQIQAIGPLLTNGKAVTSKYRAELQQMSQASMDWSKQYGISTSSINEGMAEMVRRGYSAEQTLGAMPSVLNAAKASGDDFNTVMHTSTSVLEQFGLQSKSTAGMLKNTNRVTDTLTFIANKTAAGFADLGEAMTYVGPTAHATNISLEQTAAVLGIMANRGIEGSVAGTALRSALTRMIKPSKQNAQGFKEMGINIADFKKGTLTLPGIIDKIKKNTKGWTDEQRSSAIAMAFGTEAQAGMNALISAGGDELRKYTKEAQNASGTTSKIADQLNNTDANKMARFKESVHVLSIEIGQKLLPALTPVIDKASEWIESFSNMGDGMQKFIIYSALATAAVGPLALTLGTLLKSIGSIATGTVKITGFFRAWKAGAAATSAVNAAMDAGAVSATGLGTAVSGASGAFSLLNPYVLGTVAAIGLGVAAYELFGKKLIQSSERTARWGSDVGATADKALSSMQNSTQQISDSLSNMEEASRTSTANMSANFSRELGTISKTVQTRKKEIEDGLKGLDEDVQKSVLSAAQKEQDRLNKNLQDAQKNEEQAQNILKNHGNKVSQLTAEQRAMLQNYNLQMQEDELNALKITGSKRKTIMAALNNDVKNMTTAQRQNAENELIDYQRKEVKHFYDQAKQLKKAYGANSAEYKAGYKTLSKNLDESSAKTAAAYIKVAKANHESTESIKQDMLEAGLSYKNGMAELRRQAKSASENTGVVVKETNNMSKSMKSAAKMWNNLVFDSKTGEVRTNAQEEINKAVKSSKKWNQIKLLLKEGKLSTNAKSEVATALIYAKKWDSLTWKEQKALIKTEGTQDFVKLLEESGEWVDLSLDVKNAIIHADGKKDIVDAIFQMNYWNKLTPKEQDMIIHDKASKKAMKLLEKIHEWNNLDMKTQEAVVNGDNKVIVDLLMRLGQWNSLTLKQQLAYIEDKGAKEFYKLFHDTKEWNNLTIEQKEAIVNAHGNQELIQSLQSANLWNSLSLKQLEAIFGVKGKEDLNDALLKAGEWDSLSMQEKLAQIVSKGGQELYTTLLDMGRWNSQPVEVKEAIVNAKGNDQLQQVMTDYNLWAGLPISSLKEIIAEDKASGNLKLAREAVEAWSRANPGEAKQAKALDLASLQMNMAKASVDRYRITGTGGAKTALGVNYASQAFDSAKGSVDSYRNTSPGAPKNAMGYDQASGAFNRATAGTRTWKGTSAGGAKTAKAIDNASGPANAATSSVRNFSRQSDHTVTLTTRIRTIKETISKIFHNAKGTNYHPGGMMMVNDQKGRTFRELVQLPTGESFIPQGRNVMFDAPRGTKVLRASETAKKFPGLKQYAKGTIAKPTLNSSMQVFQASTSVQDNASNIIVANSTDTSVLEKQMNQMIGLLTAILSKEQSVSLNGQSIGKFVDNYQSKSISLEERGVYSGT